MFWTISAFGTDVDILEPCSCKPSDRLVRFDDLASAMKYLERFSYSHDNTTAMQRAVASRMLGTSLPYGSALLEQLSRLLVSGELKLKERKSNSYLKDMMFARGIPWGVWNPIKQKPGLGPEEDPGAEPVTVSRKIFVRAPGVVEECDLEDCSFELRPAKQCGPSQGTKALSGAAQVRDNLLEISYPGIDRMLNYDLLALQGQEASYEVCQGLD